MKVKGTTRINRLQPKINDYFIKIIIGYAADQGMARATAAADIIKSFAKELSEKQREKYISIYNDLTESEKANPKLYQNRL